MVDREDNFGNYRDFNPSFRCTSSQNILQLSSGLGDNEDEFLEDS